MNEYQKNQLGTIQLILKVEDVFERLGVVFVDIPEGVTIGITENKTYLETGRLADSQMKKLGII